MYLFISALAVYNLNSYLSINLWHIQINNIHLWYSLLYFISAIHLRLLIVYNIIYAFFMLLRFTHFSHLCFNNSCYIRSCNNLWGICHGHDMRINLCAMVAGKCWECWQDIVSCMCNLLRYLLDMILISLLLIMGLIDIKLSMNWNWILCYFSLILE